MNGGTSNSLSRKTSFNEVLATYESPLNSPTNARSPLRASVGPLTSGAVATAHPRKATQEEPMDKELLTHFDVEEVGVLRGHFGNGWVECMKVWKDCLLSGSGDDTIRAWEISQLEDSWPGEEAHSSVMRGHKNVVKCMAIWKNKLWTGSNDASVIVWEEDRGPRGLRFLEKGKLLGHESGIYALKGWGNFLVTGSMDKTIRCWRENLSCAMVMEGSEDTINCLKILRGKSRSYLISSGQKMERIRVWNQQGKCIKILEGHDNGVLCLKSWKRKLWSGSKDFSIRGWNLKEGTADVILTGHTGQVNCLLAWGDQLYSGSSDKTIRVWRESGECLRVIEGPRSGVFCLKVWKGLLVSSGHFDSRGVYIWDAEGKSQFVLRDENEKGVRVIKVCSNGLLCGSAGNVIMVWRGVEREEAVPKETALKLPVNGGGASEAAKTPAAMGHKRKASGWRFWKKSVEKLPSSSSSSSTSLSSTKTSGSSSGGEEKEKEKDSDDAFEEDDRSSEDSF
ncbi:WD repeat-containing protein 6 [Balamuthia mandrillaris]